MKFSKTLPTEPGFYWAQQVATYQSTPQIANDPEVVQVVVDCGKTEVWGFFSAAPMRKEALVYGDRLTTPEVE